MVLKVVSITTAIAAALCIPAILIWIINNPGNEDAYDPVRQMGYQVIVAYPIAWALTPFFVRKLMGSSDADGIQRADRASALVKLILLCLASARLFYIYQTI